MSHRILHNLILTICLFTVTVGFGQSNDSTRTIKYFVLFDKFEYEDTLLARKYADSGVYYAKRTANNKLIGRAYQYKGWYYQDRSKYKLATKEFYKSLSYMRKSGDRQAIADAYGNLGNIYLDVEDFQTSLNYQLRSLTENKKIIKSKPKKRALAYAVEGKGFALHNIGEIYREIGMNDKALEYELKSLKYEIDAKNPSGEAISYKTIASIYKNKNQSDSAVYFFKKALEIYEKHPHPDGYSSTLVSYATLDNSGLEQDVIDAMMQEALDIRIKLDDADGEARTLMEICRENFDDLSVDSLSKMLKRTFEIIQEEDQESLQEDYFKLYSKYNSRIGNFDKAYFALENYLELKAISDEKSRTHDLVAGDITHNLNTRHFNDSLRLENKLAKQSASHSKDIADIQNIVYLSVIGFIILIATLSFVISSNRRRRRMNEVLSEKNKLIQEQKAIVDERNQSISDSIIYARRLQSAILPTATQINEYLPNSFLFFKPKDVVSGDFHWFEEKDGICYVAAADCTGHGVPGALVSVVCSNALNRSVSEFGLRSPKDILNKTRDLVIDTFAKSGESVADGMDISLVAIDKKKKTVVFAGAHNSMLVARNNQFVEASNYDERRLITGPEKSLIELKGDKQPIGLFSKMTSFTEQNIDLFEDDILYLFSDGFADQFGGERGKKFKYLNLKKELLSISCQSMEAQKESLVETFDAWKGDLDQLDDVCIVGIKVF